MEYNEIPTAIKILKDESQRCSFVLEYGIPRYRKVRVDIGDHTINLSAEALKTFINNQMLENDIEVKRLEGIHDTLKKVADGLLK